MKAHVALVTRIRQELEADRMSLGEMMDELVPAIHEQTIDEMYAVMTPAMQDAFAERARSLLRVHFPGVPLTDAHEPDRPWEIALRDWICRQPFPRRAWRPLAEIDASVRRSDMDVLYDLLPHLTRSTVEDALAGLGVPIWRRTLLEIADGLRPKLDVIVATARAHDRDPSAFTNLVAWADDPAKKHHVAEVVRIAREVEAGRKWLYESFYELLPFVREETIDEMLAAMPERMRSFFVSQTRDHLGAFDVLIAAGGPSSGAWTVLRDWIHRRPFTRRPLRPLGDLARDARNLTEAFDDVLPHLLGRSVEEVLAELEHPKWRHHLLVVATGLRRGIDDVVAMALANGQDPSPFTKLLAWADGQAPLDDAPPPAFWKPLAEDEPPYEPKPVHPDATDVAKHPACPSCATPSAMPIRYYGVLPLDERLDALARNEWVDGGPTIRRDAPTHECRGCGRRFVDPDAASEREKQHEPPSDDPATVRVLAALGQPDAYVTEDTVVSELLNPHAYPVSKRQRCGRCRWLNGHPSARRENLRRLAYASRLLAFPIAEDDTVMCVVDRLRAGSATDGTNRATPPESGRPGRA